MTDPRDYSLLDDMLVEGRRALRMLGDADEQALLHDDMKRYAVLYAVQIVGEAAYKVSPARKETLPNIPWERIAGIRHVIVHGYRGVKLDTVVTTVRVHMPTLIAELERFFAENPEP